MTKHTPLRFIFAGQSAPFSTMPPSMLPSMLPFGMLPYCASGLAPSCQKPPCCATARNTIWRRLIFQCSIHLS
ncbi:hypothetical protein J2D75_00795 [Acetobacter suratthaniensis]|uniref:Uncharacterized protein n=1 Tax=Acetobacter suratthaniensis TaxID=1502841 RepID=A0ABS3LIZ0_9PROT|nr:hypothetical protein [Acetobacter suratthaniensis]MBO1327012.1 hypothetical protein [Acetobacter suratthaniensis]